MHTERFIVSGLEGKALAKFPIRIAETALIQIGNWLQEYEPTAGRPHRVNNEQRNLKDRVQVALQVCRAQLESTWRSPVRRERRRQGLDIGGKLSASL